MLSFAQVPVGLAGVALGLGAVWLGVRGRLRPRTLLRADHGSVTVDGYPTLRWSSVDDVVVLDVQYGCQRQLLLGMAPNLAVPTPRRGIVALLLHLIGRAVVWGPGWLPVRADTALAPDDLADRLKQLRAAAGGAIAEEPPAPLTACSALCVHLGLGVQVRQLAGFHAHLGDEVLDLVPPQADDPPEAVRREVTPVDQPVQRAVGDAKVPRRLGGAEPSLVIFHSTSG